MDSNSNALPFTLVKQWFWHQLKLWFWRVVQIERLRKEGSRLVAEEQEKLQQQLREEASQLYCDADNGVRLRVCKSVLLPVDRMAP